MGSKHLNFKEADNVGCKTKVFVVSSAYDDSFLGEIKWYGGWRQYIFIPNADTIWSYDCLNDLSIFIKNLMDERKKDK